MGLPLLRRLRLIGEGEPACPDYLDFIFRKGYERACLLAITEHLIKNHHDWDILEPATLPEESVTLRDLPRLSASHGLVVQWDHEVISPCIRLPGDYDAYVISLSANRRGQLYNKRARLDREFQVEFGGYKEAELLDDGLEILARLNVIRMHALRKETSFSDPRFIAFHREIIRSFSDRGWVRMPHLKLDGEVVAIRYAFLYHGTWYDYNGGFDPAFEKASVSHLLIAECIRSCIEEGVGIFDFLAGAHPHKLTYANEIRRMYCLTLYNDSAYAWLAVATMSGGRFVRKLLRSARPTPSLSYGKTV